VNNVSDDRVEKALDPEIGPRRPYRGRGRNNPWITNPADILSFDPNLQTPMDLNNSPVIQLMNDIQRYKQLIEVLGNRGEYLGDEGRANFDRDSQAWMHDFAGPTKPGNEAFQRAFDLILGHTEDFSPWGVRMHDFPTSDPNRYDPYATMRQIFGNKEIKDAPWSDETMENYLPRPEEGETAGFDAIADFIRHFHGTEHDPESEWSTPFADDDGEGVLQWTESSLRGPVHESEEDYLRHVQARRNMFGLGEEGGDTMSDAEEIDFPMFEQGTSPRFLTSSRGRPTLNEVEQAVVSMLERNAAFADTETPWWERAYPNDPELWFPNLSLDQLRRMYHDYWGSIYENNPGEELDHTARAYSWLHPDLYRNPKAEFAAPIVDRDFSIASGDDEEWYEGSQDPITTNPQDFMGLYEGEMHPLRTTLPGNLARAFLDRMNRTAQRGRMNKWM